MTTVIVIVAAAGLALLADAVAVAMRRRALAKTEARRRDETDAPSIAKVIQLEEARRAAEPDERAARGPSARTLPAAVPELDPDAAE